MPYFEKAPYEMPEAELSAASIAALADQIETQIQGGLAARPLLSVPHLLSDEASCYCMPLGGSTSDTSGIGASSALRRSPVLPSAAHALWVVCAGADHGYVLAEMAVHQTREFVMARDGVIADNPKVGPTLRDACAAGSTCCPPCCEDSAPPASPRTI